MHGGKVLNHQVLPFFLYKPQSLLKGVVTMHSDILNIFHFRA